MDQWGNPGTQPVALIGGLHGAGKTHLTRAVCAALGAHHVVASQLLDVNPTNKRVRDIERNQQIITRRLRSLIRRADGPVIIDGHFALITSDGTTSQVPLRFFEPLALKALAVVNTPIKMVQERLLNRDGRSFAEDVLRELAHAEVENAKQVSNAFGIPLLFVRHSGDLEGVATFFRLAFS